MANCPIETSLSVIGDKWKVLIIRDLMSGTKRFSELKNSLTGISQKVLTEKLRDLERHNVISRQVYAVVPPKVEYSLTEVGTSLQPVLTSLATWGFLYQEKHYSTK